jgi:hypothetical protein
MDALSPRLGRFLSQFFNLMHQESFSFSSVNNASAIRSKPSVPSDPAAEARFQAHL